MIGFRFWLFVGVLVLTDPRGLVGEQRASKASCIDGTMLAAALAPTRAPQRGARVGSFWTGVRKIGPKFALSTLPLMASLLR
ncbi:hypothetical protein BC834DRAFT_367809 [Gloeopeniophorella convolvens]|nr:hypothetical protein BC834DRAFT_367809 [Gloeopeniophorella convolvens]